MRLFFEYDEVRTDFNKKDKTLVTLVDEEALTFRKITRQIESETAYSEILIKLGLKQEQTVFYRVPDSKSPNGVITWINQNIGELTQHGFELRQEQLKEQYFTDKVTLDLKIDKKKDWFDIYGTVTFGTFEVPFLKLKKHIINGKREYRLPDKSIAILPESWFAEFRDLFISGDEIMGHLHVDEHFYKVLEEAMVGYDKRYYEQLKEYEYSGELKAVPAELKADLRAYQHQGYSWMYSLQNNNFGGCLADDMGLGKTVQTIGLLTALLAENKQKQVVETNSEQAAGQLSLFRTPIPQSEPTEQVLPSLIIMPTSLVHNWQSELTKFAPQLKVAVYQGAQRAKILEQAANFDILLTSYGIARNDIDLLEKQQFFYLILDESQYIKNPESKTYKSITDLSAKHRLVLTGTPIENNLVDLWAQMNFLNPGLLGNRHFFREEFVFPIQRHNDELATKRLKSLISPFMLRRTKEQVAKDLPPLTEQEVLCEMTEEQTKVYETEKSRARNEILNKKEDKNKKTNAIAILHALMKMRQSANHPLLIDKAYLGASGKFDEIMRHTENVVTEKHKVLIFSSFVKHLQLLATAFKNEGWKYQMLTGQTTNRKAVIDRFKSDQETGIFLISLKAGGVGLNLTEADYVFILDPWWNPAAEMQALSRAHRIGQTKNVFVYRFISSNTIEEKIRNLQKQKSQLAEAFIENTDNPTKFDEETLRKLFE